MTNLVSRLPEVAFTKSGVMFCPRDDLWDWFDGTYRVHMNFLKFELSDSIPIESLKATLMVFMRTNSPYSVVNLFNVFSHFLSKRSKRTRLVSISALEVSNYLANLKDHEKWRVGTLNVLLQKWHRLGLIGVDADCTQYLREIRKAGNKKGDAVRTRDPIKGPFSEREYTALYKTVDAAYGRGKIKCWVAVLTRLLFACGGRISQYASLKLCDLSVVNRTWKINLPLVKTRESRQRVIFKEFDLSPQTGRLIQEYSNLLREHGFNDDSAMFPEEVVMGLSSSHAKRNANDPFFGHCQSLHLSQIFSTTLEEISPPSERLSFKSLPINPQRFRYTFGTRLVEEGATKMVLADRLGHTDLQNVDVYFEASPKIVENIDKAMAASLAPLSRLFMGKLIGDESQSSANGSPGSRIIDFRSATSPIGSCAASGKSCTFSKPVACYVCHKFEPWLDAPHEEVLARLEAEKARFSNDQRMASINNDTIAAIREVIAECAAVKNLSKKDGEI